MTIQERKDPVVHKFISEANLLRQYDYLISLVAAALSEQKFFIDHNTVQQLNRYAVDLIGDAPGMYRLCGVGITQSPHSPPDHPQVPELMRECLQYIADNWDKQTATQLAAYALWRLNWIHPFEEGNGRTARATCLLILCLKYKLWLPGKNTIPEQIRKNRQPYYDALREADAAWKHGKIDVSALDSYLQGLLYNQLGS